MKASYLKARLLLGIVSLVAGLLAANLALFGWQNPNGFFYLLGEYARYACAYGGFAAMILGAMLINDFFVLRTSIASKNKTRRNATAWLIRARTEWQLTKGLRKSCSREPKLTQRGFSLETEEEREVVAQ
jgi:uncharacterized membrane protein